MKSILLKVSAVLMLVALLYTMAWGQNRLEVKVVDDEGNVVKNTTVEVENENDHVPHDGSKDDKGVFVFSLPGGDYKISTSANPIPIVLNHVKVFNSEPSQIEIQMPDMNPFILGPYITNMFCGALILFLLDIWLRFKGIKDASLIWLYGSLISWCIGLSITLSKLEWLKDMLPKLKPKDGKYLVSIVSTVFFVLTAFMLSRVRDWFSKQKKWWLKKRWLWCIIVLLIVLIISFVALYLLIQDNGSFTYVDAVASTFALVALGGGLTYSYYEYGNRLFAGFTALTFIIFIWRQWYLARNITPTSGFLVPFFLANTTLVIMLFIALAVAWGLSDASRLKTVGVPVNVEVAAMFFDLRGSTQWADEVAEKEFHHVKFFIDELRDWAWEQASSSEQGPPKLVKFLGDGFMYVWEVPKVAVRKNANTVAKLAYDLSAEYLSWVKEAEVTQKFPWGTPEALGVGVDIGHAIRLTFEGGFNDYLGSPMNIAAKMQNLARPSGGVVIQEKMWGLLDNLQNKFPKQGKMKLGNTDIPIRATENVEL
jgi:class 3 adenylate cyclase